MKDVCLRYRSLLATLTLLCLSVFNAQAQEQKTSFLAELHNFRISNYQALDAFYSFSASNDTDTLNRIVIGVNSSNDAMNSLVASNSEALSQQQLGQLNQQFDLYKDLMRNNINEVRERGYPDLRLMADLANQALDMNNLASELYSIARERIGVEPDTRVESARSAAVVMAQMMARYAARTHSAVAQTFQGAATEVPLDEQASSFDTLLDAVRSGPADGELKAVLEDVAAKWQFIRASYINYNERNVSFIIDRYSKGIIEGLTSAIHLLSRDA
ncbi:hypothetical protein C7H09_13340 [Marinobacter fuscus]|uniref:Uncharacterized protein n=1 Tax=Marinobacter fuscus TaxID=2109942 RepID=A0A2T1K661_9GAMM|nr:hypothetical protein [Marinobacter fuscus]PSF05641.1 hypothetical protein C7H09_13340 [Marinobacter fuscus]